MYHNHGRLYLALDYNLRLIGYAIKHLISRLAFVSIAVSGLSYGQPSVGIVTNPLGWINVKASPYRAAGDGTSDDTAAIQKAINVAFGSSKSPHGRDYYSNTVLYFPAGFYKINRPLLFTGVQGGRIIGSGRFVTTIENTVGGNVINTNGAGYTHWEGLHLKSSRMATVFNLDWDGKTCCGSLQSNTFEDIFFDGGAYGMRIGGSGNMGSENLFLNCFWLGASVAGLQTDNFNALQNTVIGGNFQANADGIRMVAGTVSIYSVGFQTSSRYDIEQQASAHDAIVIAGSRTESRNFFSGGNNMQIKIQGVSQLSSMSGIFVAGNGATRITIDNCHSVNGQVIGNAEGVVTESEFDRNDWLVPGARTNIRAAAVVLPSSYIDSAMIDQTGVWHYPVQRMFIPIPGANGRSATLIRQGVRVTSVTLIIDTPGTAGTIDVGTDTDPTLFFKAAALAGRSTASRTIEQYFNNDNHIDISSAGAVGVVGYVAVDLQNVALVGPWK